MKRFVIGLLVTMPLLQACDSGPEGPGSLSAVVVTQGTPPGAVVLRVTGPGVTGFQELGSTRLFSREVTAAEHRLVLVGNGQEDIRFNVLVSDRGAAAPSISVVQAVDRANQALAAASVTIRLD